MPKTYAQISKELQALQVEAEKVKKDEVAEVVRKIKEAIDTYGLSEQDLFGRRGAVKAAGKKSAKGSSGAPKYADGAGNVWGGMGPRPKWLREALAGGKKLEDFLAGAASAGAAPEQGGEQEAERTSRSIAQDRSKVAGGQKHEVAYVARKTGSTQAEVRAAVKKVGNSRAKVEEELQSQAA